MTWTNFHSHTYYSDGKFSPEDYIQTAIEMDMPALGISCHNPLPFFRPWSMKGEKFAQYCGEIRQLRKKYSDNIEIYLGMEVDYVPGYTDIEFLNVQLSKLDYWVGSIHFVDTFPDGDPWEIDGPHSLFLKGFENIFQRNARAAISRYFQLTREMIHELAPPVLGHMDKIIIQSEDGQLFNDQEKWYQDEVMKTLEVVKEAGTIVEVNTRGNYKMKLDPYPGRWILERIHELEIPIMINSDCHHPQELIACFPDTSLMLGTLGFEQVTVLKGGKWQTLPFSEQGIKW